MSAHELDRVFSIGDADGFGLRLLLIWWKFEKKDNESVDRRKNIIFMITAMLRFKGVWYLFDVGVDEFDECWLSWLCAQKIAYEERRCLQEFQVNCYS